MLSHGHTSPPTVKKHTHTNINDDDNNDYDYDMDTNNETSTTMVLPVGLVLPKDSPFLQELETVSSIVCACACVRVRM